MNMQRVIAPGLMHFHLLPEGEGEDEGIDKENTLFFNPLTLALSLGERGLKTL